MERFEQEVPRAKVYLVGENAGGHLEGDIKKCWVGLHFTGEVEEIKK